MLLNTCSYFSLILSFQNGMTSCNHFGIKRVEPLNLDSLSVYSAVKLDTAVLRLPVIGNTRTEIGGITLRRCFIYMSSFCIPGCSYSLNYCGVSLQE